VKAVRRAAEMVRDSRGSERAANAIRRAAEALREKQMPFEEQRSP
jgi:hypothetical protein